ncbi:class I SAM-dependent methyltransferase [Glycomyces harbinensis]|uniref:Methyltransferase domain-containing protein n=1 Tax=Glycomyces harbinensis TaxID=58114 RepID=A0A1G6VS85_9ACTN|nr:class I SAM-dependent methyltransferase [Glycomyces harbinensis]SDD56438.1 Methyltransferase domain-containing protein [Glycomyces harbinensis]
MVTIPPRDGAAPYPDLRRAATSFGAEADRYDRARPTYPAAMVDAVIAASPGPAVLDVGVGTGIAARLFAAKGCDVLGVDVDERMAALARGHGIEVETGRFEDWDAKGRVFDTVVSAQTWHWIDPVAGAARAAEVLRAGGRLALCWNVFQPPPEVAAAFGAIHRDLFPDFPDLWARPMLETYEPMFARAEGGIRETGAFTEPERRQYDWERLYTTEGWLDGIPTSGGYSSLEPDQMERLLESTRETLDALGGSFTMRYSTIVVAAAAR